MRDPRPWLLPVLAVLFAGITQAFISTPTNLYWLHLISWAPALVVLSKATPGRGALLGWLCGASANAAIFAWLVPTVERFTSLGTGGGVAVLILFAAAFGFYGAAFGWGAAAVRRATGRGWPVALAAWFVACEFLNPQLFPYFQGVAWFQVPRVFLVSALGGIPLVTFGLLAWNGVLAAGWEAWRAQDPTARAEAGRTLRVSGAIVAALVVLGLGYSSARLSSLQAEAATAPTTRFAMVQTNLDVAAESALKKKEGRYALLNLNLAVMNEAADADPTIDVFVLPETALRAEPTSGPYRAVAELAETRRVEIWSGVSEYRMDDSGENRTYNSGYRIDRRGFADRPYDKNILVPFGEYMPLVGLFPALGKIRDMADTTPGIDPMVMTSEVAPKLAFLVCYEATRFRYTRRSVAAGARILATVTYDGWFGDTGALDQHMMLSAAASAATGVPMVRAATTGISVAVGADGVLLGRTARAQKEVLVVDVPAVARPSLYVALGDWFAFLCILAGFGAVWAGLRGEAVARRTLIVPALFLASATITWQINPFVGGLEKAVWLGAVLMFSATAGGALRRS